MGKHRTAWHLLASTFMDERRPSRVRIETEVALSKQPSRADLLLIRKDDGPVDDAKAFFRLWALMGPVALAEYKSRSRPPRLGTLDQLLGYGHQYRLKRFRERDKLPAKNLSLFLMVADITKTLRKDVGLMGLELGQADGAYVPVLGTVFPHGSSG